MQDFYKECNEFIEKQFKAINRQSEFFLTNCGQFLAFYLNYIRDHDFDEAIKEQALFYLCILFSGHSNIREISQNLSDFFGDAQPPKANFKLVRNYFEQIKKISRRELVFPYLNALISEDNKNEKDYQSLFYFLRRAYRESIEEYSIFINFFTYKLDLIKRDSNILIQVGSFFKEIHDYERALMYYRLVSTSMSIIKPVLQNGINNLIIMGDEIANEGKELAKAKECFVLACSMDPAGDCGSWQADVRLAKYYFYFENPVNGAKISRHYLSAIKNAPFDECLKILNNFEECIKEYRTISAKDLIEIEDNFNKAKLTYTGRLAVVQHVEGLRLIDEKQYQDGFALVCQANVLSPNNTDICYTLAELNEKGQNATGAADYLAAILYYSSAVELAKSSSKCEKIKTKALSALLRIAENSNGDVKNYAIMEFCKNVESKEYKSQLEKFAEDRNVDALNKLGDLACQNKSNGLKALFSMGKTLPTEYYFRSASLKSPEGVEKFLDCYQNNIGVGGGLKAGLHHLCLLALQQPDNQPVLQSIVRYINSSNNELKCVALIYIALIEANVLFKSSVRAQSEIDSVVFKLQSANQLNSALLKSEVKAMLTHDKNNVIDASLKERLVDTPSNKLEDRIKNRTIFTGIELGAVMGPLSLAAPMLASAPVLPPDYPPPVYSSLFPIVNTTASATASENPYQFKYL